MPRTKKKKEKADYSCAACGQLFPAKRDDATYCGPTCRQRASRDTRARLAGSAVRARKITANLVECRRCGVQTERKHGACCACGVKFTNKK